MSKSGLFAEYRRQHLTFHLLDNERWEDLARISFKMKYLDDKVQHLGVASLLKDYAAIKASFPQDHPEWKNLNRLYRLVRQEAHVFESWDPQELPLLFLQQMRNKAFEQRWTWLQRKTEKTLARRGVWLRLVKRLGRSRSPITRAMRHGNVVQSVAFSPDGQSIASGGNDSRVCLWDLETDSEKRELNGHQGRVIGVAFSPDGRVLVSVADEGRYGSICLWDTLYGRLIWTRRVEGGVKCAALSSDDEKIATGDMNGTVRLWSIRHRELVHALKHPGSIDALAFSADNQTVASACADGFVRLWDVRTGLESQRLGGRKGRCNCVAFSPNGRLFAWAGSSRDPCICMWDLQAGSMLWESKIKTFPIFDPYPTEAQRIEFSPDSAHIAFGTVSHQVGLLDAATGRKVRGWSGHDGLVNSVSFSPGGELLASGSLDGSIRLWPVSSPLDKLSRKQKIRLYKEATPGGLFRTVSSFSYYLLEIVRFIIRNLPRYHPISRLWLHRLYGDANRSVAFSHDGRLAVVGLRDEGVIQVWDIRERKQILEISETGGRLGDVVLSPDGRLLVLDFGYHIHVWELNELQEIQRMATGGLVHHLALSPDGKMLACSTWDGEIQLWDLDQGRKLAKHQVDWAESYVRFLPKGRVVQVLDGNSNELLPNIWWLSIEGLDSSEPNQKTED